jgi:hypothetical protein
MPNDYPIEQQPQRRHWTWMLLILLLLPVGADQVYRLFSHSRARAEVDALRKEGYPVGLMELQNWPGVVPDQQNAAIRILEAADSLALAPDALARIKWPTGAQEFGPEERDTLQDILTNNAPALESLHLAAQLKQCRFPVDYSRGPAALLPHLAKVKSLSTLLRVEAALRSEEGQPDLAVKSVLESVALARSLDTEPLLISQLVRIACLSISCSSLERVLTQHALSQEQLRALAESFRAAREASQTAFVGGYVGEVAMGVFCFSSSPSELTQLMSPESPASSWANVLFPLYSWTGLRDRDYLFYIRGMHRMLNTSKMPFPERLANARQNGDELNREIAAHKLLIFSRMLLPALQRSTEKSADIEARLRCAEEALAVERLRLEKRPVAEALVQAAQGANSAGGLTDPIDGAPLRSRALQPGYVIYSIGLDGTDDGGAGAQSSEDSGVRKIGQKPQRQTRLPKDRDTVFAVHR